MSAIEPGDKLKEALIKCLRHHAAKAGGVSALDGTLGQIGVFQISVSVTADSSDCSPDPKSHAIATFIG